MSNIYFVTLSYSPDDYAHYFPAIRKIYADEKNSKVLICRQFGSSGTHRHYHLLIETDTDIIQKFRMRFRTYMKPLRPTSRNLDIVHRSKPGISLNYFARDPTSRIITTKKKQWDMKELQAQAVANPDPGIGKQELPWSQVYRKLLMVGWKYPERPGKYLKLLTKDWYIYHIITNPKKLAQILRFESNSDDWDDIYLHADNLLKGF